MSTHQDLTTDLYAVLRAAAQRIVRAEYWPELIVSAYAGFELATRTARALVDTSPIEEHVRLAEAERAATDGRDILRAAPGRMNASGPLGAPIVLAADQLAVTEAALSRLADAVADRFGVALDEPLNAGELVAFSEVLDAADRLQRALTPETPSQQKPSPNADRMGSAGEVDDGDRP